MTKTQISILDKVKVCTEVLDLARNEDGKMDYILFEIGKVVYITQAYCGNDYDFKYEDGRMNMIATYENIVSSEFWSKLEKNADVQHTIKLIEKKYEEEFIYSHSFESRLIDVLEKMIENAPEEKDITKIVEAVGELAKKK